MPGGARLWMRHETRPTERRAPIVPDDARRLVDLGFELTVEASPQRIFAAAEYEAAGCRIAPAGTWMRAPDDCVVLGLKELPPTPASLSHRHVFFGHAFKGQEGAGQLLQRFAAGGGALLDMEYLVDDQGRRLAAFGYWAGYAGAALAVLRMCGRLDVPLRPVSKAELDDAVRELGVDHPLRVLVIGALGRCGRGARDVLAVAGYQPTCWDIEETRQLDRRALLDHDVLINAVFTNRPVPSLLTHADLDDAARRLALVCDITCDVNSPCNVVPIYEQVTSWREPVRRLRGGDPPADLIAIDNLPSLLPKEASTAFSAELTPQLMLLGTDAPVWQRCLHTYHQACRSVGIDLEFADV